MTEEEAKKKWCLFRQICVSTSNVGLQISSTLTDEMKELKSIESAQEVLKTKRFCIASECMMWRWNSFTPKEMKAKGGNIEKCKGRCGLAKCPTS